MDGRFRLLLLEAETGRVLNEDGTLHNSEAPPRFTPSFAARGEAIALKDQLLPQFPWAVAKIYDSVTRLEEWFDAGPAHDEYAESMRRWRRWAYAPPAERLLMTQPPTPRGPRQLGQRFRLTVVDAETGVVLNRDGTFQNTATQSRYAPGFATREEALALRDELLQELPFAEVVVFDATTGTRETFRDEAALQSYLDAMRRWRTWAHASPLRRLFMSEPPRPRSPWCS